MNEWYNQTSAEKVADAVGDIEGEACRNPCEHSLEIKSEHESLCRGIKYAVNKSVK